MRIELQRHSSLKGAGDYVREIPEDKQSAPCFVRHPDAGGKCGRTAVVKVYLMPFCESHGREAKMAALSEAGDNASTFFEGFRSLHVPQRSLAIQRGLEVVLEHLRGEYPSSSDWDHALIAAYPNPPEEIVERVRTWQQDEEPGYAPVFDILLDSLNLLHRLMRIAHESGAGWLVELLEYKREEFAVQAAVAAEEADRGYEEAEDG